MPEESKERKENKERSPQQLAESRREARAKMPAEDKCTQEAAEIHRAPNIKALKGSAATTTLNTARTRLVGEQCRGQGGGHSLP
jgi:hypothetical protein